jgi:hypothetical protein
LDLQKKSSKKKPGKASGLKPASKAKTRR